MIEEERVYSVMMSEVELRLFSEFLEQKTYDYCPEDDFCYLDESAVEKILADRAKSARNRRLAFAAIGATAYGIHRHVKKKKQNKKEAESKFKVSNDNKKSVKK